MGYIAIVDYHLGNLFSVQRACVETGLDARITFDKKQIEEADGVILPGVGAFGDAMEMLRKQDIVVLLQESIRSGKPFLGICLGMQLLMSQSEEFGVHEGLNVFSGNVVRFPEMNNEERRIKVPHVGWDKIFYAKHHSSVEKRWDHTLLTHLDEGSYMYFVHSYRVVPDQEDVIVCSSVYESIPYVSGIAKKNVSAFQFHPEKSGLLGIQIYRNFARVVAEYKHRR